ncbi:MAG: Daunorubicin/doxorubicin resistance ATP-binding protein DrrA [Acidimicrobiales bacterium]|nr:MAG: ABC transporter ATP-binding protein [Actinomycetota bacterium]MBV6508087.1 Daunorubicin/doxorubicin resistance ATP-binding protein DrrA [Acidimicrobiales bacterium]RIK05289.1 MAG: export ABC transporter ATP-binding protein [Acidobacteriota bacterium]
MVSVKTPVVQCSGLQKTFGDRRAVDDVGFEIAEGETYGLLGPNGAGKTTTISMVCGLLEPEVGTTTVAGLAMGTRNAEAKAQIGFVPQEVALYPDLTGRENLRFFGRLQHMEGKRLKSRVEEVLDLVGLVERADERTDAYSGGMKRRCNIAAGLLHEPKLLILDEPTVGVDPQSRHAILESIETLGGAGLSVLYTTHYMEEAERLCDRVGIIDEGRIIAEGTKRELVELVGENAHVRLTGAGDLPGFADRARSLAVVERADLADGVVDLEVSDASRALAPIIETAEGSALDIRSVDVVEPDLESVFLRLTGKALRD